MTEQNKRLPRALLQAIALTESGRFDSATAKRYAWPWTVNSGGEGHFLDSKEEAIAVVRKLRAQGKRNIDVGCMQVNLHFHPHAFANLDVAFDPFANADYAGSFLNDLRVETGTWARAIERYHSNNRRRGNNYRSKVNANWRSVRKGDVLDADAAMFASIAVGNSREETMVPKIVRGRRTAVESTGPVNKTKDFAWLTGRDEHNAQRLLRPTESEFLANSRRRELPENASTSAIEPRGIPRSTAVEPAAGQANERPQDRSTSPPNLEKQTAFSLLRGIDLATSDSVPRMF